MALTLYTWPPCTSSGWQAAALPSVCVECLAVEAYLHLLGVAFTVQHCTAPEQSPTGALPACVFDDEQAPGCQTRHGEVLGPEARAGAVQHVSQAVADLDLPLRRDLQAQSVAFAALLHACLAPALVRLETGDAAKVTLTVQAAWGDDAAYAKHTRPGFGDGLPFGSSRWLTARWRASQLRHVTHSVDATLSGAVTALTAVSGRLGHKEGKYLLGSEPCGADALLIAYLAYIRKAPGVPAALREAVTRDARLMAYCDGLLMDGALFRHMEQGPRPGMPPMRKPRVAGASGSGPGGEAGGQRGGGASGQWLSERRKSQLSVAFALGSCAAYVLLNDLIDISFEYDDDDEMEEEDAREDEADGGDE